VLLSLVRVFGVLFIFFGLCLIVAREQDAMHMLDQMSLAPNDSFVIMMKGRPQQIHDLTVEHRSHIECIASASKDHSCLLKDQETFDSEDLTLVGRDNLKKLAPGSHLGQLNVHGQAQH